MNNISSLIHIEISYHVSRDNQNMTRQFITIFLSVDSSCQEESSQLLKKDCFWDPCLNVMVIRISLVGVRRHSSERDGTSHWVDTGYTCNCKDHVALWNNTKKKTPFTTPCYEIQRNSWILGIAWLKVSFDLYSTQNTSPPSKHLDSIHFLMICYI